MNTENRIRTLEKTYRGRLECFFNSVYPAGKFVSHGIDHHRRVWNFAKELINCTYKENPDTGIFKKLMIACFLHDIGMSVNPGIKHGYQSRKICEEFLNVNHLPISKFNDVLQAIEVHDEKEYHFNDRNENYILKILSAADDLDAFGYIGVFRYTEIYLFRGTDPADLGHVILSNASNRIRYFSSKFAMYPDLVSKHRKRFEMLYEFFRLYNMNCSEYKFGTGNPSGYCGVTEIIMKNINNPDALSHHIPEQDYIQNDKVIKAFFTELMNELA